MLPIEFKDKDNAKISFNSEFYSMYVLSEVCERFQPIFKMKVEFQRDNKKLNVYFRQKEEMTQDEFKTALLEFINHAIHEAVSVAK